MREMKYSGIEWIGCIPNNWGMYHLKYLCNFKTGGTPSDKMGIDSINIGYPWITPQDIIDRIYIENFTQYISQEAINQFGYKLFPPKSILLVCIASIGKVGIVRENCYANQQITALLPYESRVVPKFILYFVKAASQKIAYDASSNVVPIINTSYLKQFYCVVPSLSEQRRIASFLDAKCTEIDALTADIQEQIDTLEQYKHSVITETVTKGLNPDAKMKDGGEEWVGAIPTSWEIKKGKYLFEQRNLRGNLIELQLLSPTQKYGVIPQSLYEELSGMSAVKLNEKTDLMLLKTIHKGDYCISLRSFQGGFEYSEYEGVVSPAYQVFYPTVEIADGYYKYLFKESGFIEKMNSYTMTLRDGKNIAFADFGNTYIPYPPIPEQQVIADFLDAKCAKIDEIISQKREQLAIIEEYKKSLIFEYVTGKKEVNAWK